MSRDAHRQKKNTTYKLYKWEIKVKKMQDRLTRWLDWEETSRELSSATPQQWTLGTEDGSKVKQLNFGKGFNLNFKRSGITPSIKSR